MNTNGKAFIGGKVNVDGKFYEEDKVAVEKPVVNVQELSLEELIETLIETLRFLQMEPKIVDNETYVINLLYLDESGKKYSKIVDVTSSIL